CSMIQRIIPSSGESLPVIGMGTWQTFDVGDQTTHPELTKVLQAMYEGGGRLIDSSPMYGRSERTIGDITSVIDDRDDFFYATKVWTTGEQQGIEQMHTSMRLMQRSMMDLIQIHNLVDWETHYATLEKWKAEGIIRYIGITHYQDTHHEILEATLRKKQFDFVQFNYSILSRNAEKRLLPACADLGVATIINRPFGEGKLFAKVKDQTLPLTASIFEIENWSQWFLKYIISHPAVTCVIPATANPLHAALNMRAGEGDLPDKYFREEMAAVMEEL
ncbi:MAG: aldo/keto reductase, partial [Sediminibacterium sp.]|nr:aldo/keto reductase [Sediminibacterium sp.]